MLTSSLSLCFNHLPSSLFSTTNDIITDRKYGAYKVAGRHLHTGEAVLAL